MDLSVTLLRLLRTCQMSQAIRHHRMFISCSATPQTFSHSHQLGTYFIVGSTRNQLQTTVCVQAHSVATGQPTGIKVKDIRSFCESFECHSMCTVLFNVPS